MVGGSDNDRCRVMRRLGARGWGVVRFPCSRRPRGYLLPPSLSEGGAFGRTPHGGFGGVPSRRGIPQPKTDTTAPTPLNLKGTLPKISQL